MPTLFQRHLLDLIGNLFGLADLSNDFQVIDTLTNGSLGLVRPNEASKNLTITLPLCYFSVSLCPA